MVAFSGNPVNNWGNLWVPRNQGWKTLSKIVKMLVLAWIFRKKLAYNWKNLRCLSLFVLGKFLWISIWVILSSKFLEGKINCSKNKKLWKDCLISKVQIMFKCLYTGFCSQNFSCLKFWSFLKCCCTWYLLLAYINYVTMTHNY